MVEVNGMVTPINDLRFTASHEAGHFFIGLWYHVTTGLIGLPKSVIYDPPLIQDDLLIEGETTYTSWCYDDDRRVEQVKFYSCLAGVVAVKVMYPTVGIDKVVQGADLDLEFCYDMMKTCDMDLKEAYVDTVLLLTVCKDQVDLIVNELVTHKRIDTIGGVGSSIMEFVKNNYRSIKSQIKSVEGLADELFEMV